MKTEDLTTDELFKALPSFINVKGTFYHFGLHKGNKRIIVEYKTNNRKGGKNLGDTYRSGKNLKEALKSMLDWLIKFDYYDQESRNILLDMIRNSKNNV